MMAPCSAVRRAATLALLWFDTCVFTVLPADAKTCNRIIPGLDKMVRGVDITTLDLNPIAHANVMGGMKMPALKFSCDKNAKWHARDGAVFDQPDQVWQVTSQPSGKASKTNKLYKSYDEVRDSMSANVGLGVAYKLFAFSASSSYESLQEAITNTSRYVSEMSYTASAREVMLKIDKSVRLDSNAKSILMNARNFRSNPEPYRRFIELFGTHYFAKAKFGGCIKKIYITEMSYFYTHSEKDFQAEAQASYGPFFSLNVGMSSASSKDKSNFTKNTEQHVVYYGGDTNLLNKDGINRWQPTVDKDPWLVSGQLSPLSELVRWDPVTRAGLEAATLNHVLKAYLGEAQRLVATARSTLESNNAHLESLSQRLKTLTRTNVINKNQILRLKKDLTPPLWFTEGTKLCFKWLEEIDNHQCGDKNVGETCASPNELTLPYKDDTDSRPSGCKLQWRIRSKNHEPWFNRVKICLQWTSHGDQNQCGRGIRPKTCALVNRFTDEYLDDTDSRPKGCGMRWKLRVPDDAPLWLHTTQLCLTALATPGGDSSQCNQGRPSVALCAPANHWTPEYVDDTDQRPGGCLMKWGLKRLF